MNISCGLALRAMNKNRRLDFLWVILFFFFSSLQANGRTFFSDLDLSAGDQLLFRAGAPRGVFAQEALFIADLSTHGFPIRQLSAFPEKMDLLDNGRTIQIRNAFGAVRLPISGGLPIPVPGLPSFANAAGIADTSGFADGIVETNSRAEEMAASHDGRWLLYLDPISPAFGNLVMIDVHSGTKIQIARGLERPEKQFPATWSPDSRLFVYERDGRLYHYTIGSSLMPDNENLRFIGEGTVNSICWGQGGDFFYLRGSTLYQLQGTALFALALYSDFLALGTVAGRLPFEFDPYFDNFWVAPDARSMLVSKGRRSIFYYPLTMDVSSSPATMPYLMLPRSCSQVQVFWPAGGTVTVLASIPNPAGTLMRAWRLLDERHFELLAPLGIRPGSFSSGSLSPDGQLALIWGAGGILLYDYADWMLLEVLSTRSAGSCLWLGNNSFITGDDQRIDRIWLTDRTIARRELLCLSTVQRAVFEEDTFRILARNGESWYVTDGRNPWAPINNPRLRNPSHISDRYRVYLERQNSSLYANLPMIRNVTSVGTFSLFPPAATQGVSPSRPLEVALSFDLYDDDKGLPETLAALNYLGVKATFFLNGEFIRRHPDAAAAIAAAGHECASMFFAPIDLSDIRYRMEDDFIARGLARNEDEFFRATGKELALIWHPPWYIFSPEIAAAAAMVGYTTIGRDIDPLDWVSLQDEKRLWLPHYSPAQMIDKIMEELKPGAVIPIRLGLLPGGRKDYLFNRISLLLDNLIRQGYTLTTVSELSKP